MNQEESLNPVARRGYRWILALVGVLLVIIAIVGYVVYSSLHRPIIQPDLSPVQKQTLVFGLNRYAEEHPLSTSERTALITGKAPATSATTSKASPATNKK